MCYVLYFWVVVFMLDNLYVFKFVLNSVETVYEHVSIHHKPRRIEIKCEIN